jgi:hypothetical protein
VGETLATFELKHPDFDYPVPYTSEPGEARLVEATLEALADAGAAPDRGRPRPAVWTGDWFDAARTLAQIIGGDAA